MFKRVHTFIRRRMGAGWALLDQGLVSLSNFVSVYLLARYMDVADFGVFSLAFAALLFFTSVHHAAIAQPHNTLAAKETGDDYRRFTTLLGIVQLLFATGCGLFLVLLGLADHLLNLTGYGTTVILLGIILIPWLIQEFVRRVLYTRQNSPQAGLNDLVSYGGQVAGVGLLVFYEGIPNLADVLIVYGASSLAAAVLGAWQLRDHLSPLRAVYSPGAFRAFVLRVWRFGKWLIGSNVMRWFGSSGHSWLLSALLGVASLGIYRAGAHLVNVLNPIQQAAHAYLPARASMIYKEGGRKKLMIWFRRTCILMGIPYLLLVAALIVFAPQLVTLAYGDKFAGWHIEWVVMLSAGAYFLSFTNSLLQMLLVAMEESRVIFQATLISVALLATSGLLIISVFGIYGPPISGMVISSVLILYAVWVFRQLREGLPATIALGKKPPSVAREHRPSSAGAPVQ